MSWQSRYLRALTLDLPFSQTFTHLPKPSPPVASTSNSTLGSSHRQAVTHDARGSHESKGNEEPEEEGGQEGEEVRGKPCVAFSLKPHTDPASDHGKGNSGFTIGGCTRTL